MWTLFIKIHTKRKRENKLLSYILKDCLIRNVRKHLLRQLRLVLANIYIFHAFKAKLSYSYIDFFNMNDVYHAVQKISHNLEQLR